MNEIARLLATPSCRRTSSTTVSRKLCSIVESAGNRLAALSKLVVSDLTTSPRPLFTVLLFQDSVMTDVPSPTLCGMCNIESPRFESSVDGLNNSMLSAIFPGSRSFSVLPHHYVREQIDIGKIEDLSGFASLVKQSCEDWARKHPTLQIGRAHV